MLAKVLANGPNYFTFGEVIEGAGEAVTPDMYYNLGQVTEFDFSRKLAPNFQSQGKLDSLSNFGTDWGLMPSDNAVTFIDNHDTQRGEAILTYKDGAVYTLANVFMLAHPYGHPKVMSSYAFNDHDQGPPSTPVHQGSSVNCAQQGPWICEHRQPQIAGMVAFRKLAGDSAVTNFAVSDDKNAVAFGREGNGFVLINRGQNTWTVTLDTGLAAGTYKDILGVLSSSVTVGSDQKAQFEVPSMSAVALTSASKQ